MNYLHFILIFYTFVVLFVGLNVLYVKNTPSVVVRLLKYGKSHKSLIKQDSFVKCLEIPKRWFFHAYMFGSLYFLVIVSVVMLRYLGNVPSPFFVQLLDWLGSSKRESTVNAESVVIASVVFFLHLCRRLYECLFISVYSDAKMNILIYTVGLIYLIAMGLAMLHDAPGFETHDVNSTNYISGEWFTFPHFMGVVCLLFASSLQFKTHKALASLRETGGKVKSTGHYLPVSGFFEYVSNPHFFAEILIYLSISIILGGKSYSWWLVFLLTASNQIISGLMNHQWYKETFKNYPVKRKAIIPFLL